MTDSLQFNVFVADVVRIDPAWRHENYQCRYWRLYRNDRDGAFLEFPTYSYPLLGGRLYLVPAGLTFHTRSAQTVSHFFIHFDVAGLPDLALRTLFHHPLCLPPSPTLEAMVSRTAAEMTAAGGGPKLWAEPGIYGQRQAAVAVQWQLKAILYEALALSLQSVPAPQIERCWQFADDIAPFLRALRYIEEHLAERLPNRDLARMCGISEDHFIRRFRQSLGQTPARYILERRVTLAAQRLRFTRQSLEQIAEDLGFSDRPHLSRAFRASQGTSPAAYRKHPPG